MNTIDFENAYYIKLGRGGKWVDSSIGQKKLRIGWSHQTIQDINEGRWPEILGQLQQESKDKGVTDKGVATRDCNALRLIAESGEQDIWITFHSCRLWWGRLGKPGVFRDEISKYRELIDDWSDNDKDGKPLLVSMIPGAISQLQGFRGTACRVKEVEQLRRLLNCQPSEAYLQIDHSRQALVDAVEKGIRNLHWRDFEILVDLVFTRSGWRRQTPVGETLKDVDMELVDPITGDIYQVQVKAQAGLPEFKECAARFDRDACRRFYFVVHSPSPELAKHRPSEDEAVELFTPQRTAAMVVNLGLVDWLMAKIR